MAETRVQPDPRTRMIESAVSLFRERGVHGTSFADVLEHSGAPRGSLYHWFPGGKAELAEAATRYAGDVIAAGLAAALDEKDPAAAVRGFARLYRQLLRSSEFAAGCPIVSATLEGDRSPGARDAAAAAFASWQELLASAFMRRGLEAERAASIAALVIAAIEGGIVLARAERSMQPLESVAGEIELLVTGVVT